MPLSACLFSRVGNIDRCFPIAAVQHCETVIAKLTKTGPTRNCRRLPLHKELWAACKRGRQLGDLLGERACARGLMQRSKADNCKRQEGLGDKKAHAETKGLLQ